MDSVSIFLLAFAAVFIVGIVGEIVFEKTNVPDVLWLMLVGIIVGPITGLVTREQLGVVAPYFGALTLVVVLFAGGSRLRLAEVSQALPRATLLAVTGFVFSSVLVAVVSMLAAQVGILPEGWTWLHGLTLGTILGGSSSIVIMPALAKTKLRAMVSNVIGLESALTDVFCVVGTGALVGLITSGSASAGEAVIILGKSFGVGLLVGVVVGLVWLMFLRHMHDHEHAYPATLSILLVLYVTVGSLGGSPALAILATAIIVGNASSLSKSVGLAKTATLGHGVQVTHTQITFIIKSFFFTFIGAMLGPPWGLVGLGVVLGLMLLAGRLPAAIVASTRSDFSYWERGIVAVTLPRGMAAGVLSLMPHYAGVPDSEAMPVVVFAAVLTTIVVFAAGFPIAQARLAAEAAQKQGETQGSVAVEVPEQVA